MCHHSRKVSYNHCRLVAHIDACNASIYPPSSCRCITTAHRTHKWQAIPTERDAPLLHNVRTTQTQAARAVPYGFAAASPYHTSLQCSTCAAARARTGSHQRRCPCECRGCAQCEGPGSKQQQQQQQQIVVVEVKLIKLQSTGLIYNSM